MSKLSENIKKRRIELGLTLQEIGDYLGVSKQTIQKYENDIITGVTTTTIEKLSEILKTAPPVLLGWQTEFENGLIETNLSKTALLTQFHKLNDTGQKEAIKAVTNLTYVPEYTQTQVKETQDHKPQVKFRLVADKGDEIRTVDKDKWDRAMDMLDELDNYEE